MGIPVFFASHIPGRRFALGNRIHWLCRPAGANRTRVRAAFPLPSVPGFALENRIYWLCRPAGANREDRAPGINRRCWRGLTKAQGLAGSKAPTWKAARRGNGASVGVARRRRKGLREARRQHGSPRAGVTAPLLAWPNEGAKGCGEQGANRGARAPGIGNRKRAAAAALFVSLTSVVLFRQKCSFQ